MSQLVSAIFTLLGVAGLVISAWPPILHDKGPEYLSTTPGRWMLFGGGFVLFFLSARIDRGSKRKNWREAWNDFALRHGGRLEEGRARLMGTGIRLDAIVEVPTGDRTMQLCVTREGETMSTRFGGPVEAPQDLHIFVVPQSAAMRLITSPAVSKFLRRQLPAEQSPAASTERREAELLLFGDPTPTGDKEFDGLFLVRASDPVRAHKLLDDGSFRHAFVELRGPKHKTFTWGLAPDPKSGEMRVEYCEWGVVMDGDRLDRMHALQVRALDRLTRLEEAA